jgi:hypothetical protein
MESSETEKSSSSSAGLIQPSTTGSTASMSTSLSASPSASPSSSSSNTGTNSNYYQRRFNGTKRRTELLEKLARNNNNASPNKSSNKAGYYPSNPNKKASTYKNTCTPSSTASIKIAIDTGDAPEFPDDENENDKDRKPLSPPSLKPNINTRNANYDIDDGIVNEIETTTQKRIDRVKLINKNRSKKITIPDEPKPSSFSTPERQRGQCQRQRQPLHSEMEGEQQQQILEGLQQQHQQNQEEDEEKEPIIRYYRIVYRGVVALLSNEPTDITTNTNDKKSGKYLGFGEIIASSSERLIEDITASSQQQQQHHPTKIKTQPTSPRRLGSAVDSPILAGVLLRGEREHHHQQQQQPQSPPRSLVSGTGSACSSLGTHQTYQRAYDTISTFTNNTAITENSTTTASSHDLVATTTPSSSIKMRKVIRVDRVLTGGYAFDAANEEESSSNNNNNNDVNVNNMTPKRGNIQCMTIPLLCSSLLPIPDNNNNNNNNKNNNISTSNTSNTSSSTNTVAIQQLSSDKGNNNSNINNDNNSRISHHGYIFSEQSYARIAIPIPIDIVPKCEHGSFMYKVICSTPVPILTGPCLDAPPTKGILIPGTVHEVCLRVVQQEEEHQKENTMISFLRLTRRRGWVADRKIIPMASSVHNTNNNNNNDSGGRSWIPLMKEISNEEVDECGLSVTSRGTSGTIMSSALATPISSANRRHRPPRRKRGVIDSNPLPRHVVGPSLQYRNSNNNNNNNDASALTDTSTSMNNSQHQHHDPRAIMSPASNISLLSDDASSIDCITNKSYGGNLSPDRSVARSTTSSSVHQPSFFLMRVNAPRGLKILDAPHFQVNNLIHGSHGATTSGGASTGCNSHHHHHHHHHDDFSASAYPATKDAMYGKAGNQSIFQTMTGHHQTTTLTSKTSNPAIFDSITKARKLPRGSVFEATKRLEASNAFSQGAGLIKLSDNSGWAIVPRQDELNDQYRSYSGSLAYTREGEATKAFEEVGNSIGNNRQDTIFLRVLTRAGVSVSLPPIPNTESDIDTSPTSSTAGSSVVSSTIGLKLGISSQGSDVASSVGSSFLDSMFRTPRKVRELESNESKADHKSNHNRPPIGERNVISTTIPCGTCVEVDRWVDPSDMEHYLFKNEFARLRGGQGWIPRFVNGKPVVATVTPPEFRFGSVWFRVRERKGIKVRLGPSRRASSIKSDDGVYFRFECGEFLRASEVVTFFRHNSTQESFAKLYRNRHVRLHTGELRPLSSLTAQAEWVQVFGDGELCLDECATEPRIERHRQGWRYNVVLDARVTIRKGPSFEAETVGVVLLGGESVLVNERVTSPDDSIAWLRLKDGQGWAHNIGRNGESLMIPHSLRHRMAGAGRPSKPGRSKQEDIAYNTIIARLFHNDTPGDSPPRRLK